MPKTSSFDQSYSAKTLSRVLWKKDFFGVLPVNQESFRTQLINNAVTSAESYFNTSPTLLKAFPLKGKVVYQMNKHEDALVERKLRLNLKKCTSIRIDSRNQIISCLKLLLEEGVPYRIYRLDIRSFFESFQLKYTLDTLSNIKKLNPQSNIIIENLLNAHASIGGLGVPRGLSISSILSEILMHDFDNKIRSDTDTFYYSRFVDDIIIVSSAREDKKKFLDKIVNWLPTGLELNKNKNEIVSIDEKVKYDKTNSENIFIEFNYLGYKFSVQNPKKHEQDVKNEGEPKRKVKTEISIKKIKKIKTRIIRSLLDYTKTKDFNLLIDRIAFLTKNFSVFNPKSGGKKIAGIYYNYPLITEDSKSLKELDKFLTNSILSKNGRIFSKTSKIISQQEKRKLLSYSFESGHKNRTFVYFSARRISEIQRCWAY